MLYVGKARSLKKRVQSYARIDGQNGRIARADRRDRGDGVRLDPHRDRGAAARGQPDQAAPPALQRAAARRQVVPLHPDHRATTRRRRSSSIAARAAARATISAPSPRPARSAAPSTRCSAPSCSAPARTASTRAGRGPASSTRSSAARRPAPARSRIDDYAELVDEAKAFLSGRARRCRTELAAEMAAASERLDFERAAVYRDRLAALSPHRRATRASTRSGIEEADVFACHQDGGADLHPGLLLPHRPELGQPRLLPARRPRLDCAEVLGAFLAQFYDDKPVPRLVLLSHDIEERELLEEALSEKAGHTRRGAGAAARREEGPRRPRARPTPARRSAASSPNRRRRRRCSPASPSASASPSRRGGSRSTTTATSWAPTPVGAMIVAGPEGFVKAQYRKFNIALGATHARRRLRHDARDARPPLRPPRQGGRPARGRRRRRRATSRPPPRPGPTSSSSTAARASSPRAETVLAELGIADLPLVGVAKGPDRDAGRETFHRDRPRAVHAPAARPGALLRPAAARRGAPLRHRLAPRRAARSTWRRTRSTRSPASARPGSAPSSAISAPPRRSSRASVEDLVAVEGISAQMARMIHDHFHEGAS